LQRHMLDRLMTTAKWNPDKALAAHSCSYMLRALQPYLSVEIQKSLAAELW